MFNYNIITRYRNRHGGGVALMIKKNLNFSKIDSLNDLEFEITGAKIKLHNSVINVITFYLPPDNQKNKNRNQFSTDLFNMLDKYKPYILLGDLNCHSKS